MKIEAKGCNLLTKPDEEENCTGEMCTYYKWIVSEWNQVRLIITNTVVLSKVVGIDIEKYIWLKSIVTLLIVPMYLAMGSYSIKTKNLLSSQRIYDY